MLFTRERGRCGPDVPLPQALQLRRSSSTPALAGQSTGWQVADPPQFAPISRPDRAVAHWKGRGRGVRKAPPKNPPTFKAISAAPNFPQTPPTAQSPPKLFLAVVVHKCAN